ncbi:uncharacterized protein LOC134229524 [Saccostrea cucullata]|uniref:uncharacterized protein LOC134229524 n=1 Tax=Saccostrea cuccullata TaxID=36930 RepID=UPI002ED6AF5D
MGLCKKLGTSHQLSIRRDVMEVFNILNSHVRADDIAVFSSGSRSEGFRLKESDVDMMIWPNNHRVIWDVSQTRYYHAQRRVTILSDNSDSPPGYTLLWLPVPRASNHVVRSTFKMNDRYYISSSLYRENVRSVLISNSNIHGPCSLGVIEGFEYDYAHCFASDFWPPSASSWIERCHLWPKRRVVHDIITSGCHFVAIGHSLGKHLHHEWRISFLKAEQKLTYTMNHCQFLTYGLLKLFLNEVINIELSEEEKLLCSYHMKTAIFWVLQENKIPQWTPQNLLECFWVCFKLILKWVYEGVCPNFFIPENNMFLTKIYGEPQVMLFLQLFTLYEKGISCLLLSPSIRPYIINALYNPQCPIRIDEKSLIAEAESDAELFEEIDKNDPPPDDLDFDSYKSILDQIEKLMGFHLSKYHIVMLQNYTSVILQRTAFLIHNTYMSYKTHTEVSKNKVIYIPDKLSCHMLKLAAKFGCISDRLYLAMYYYQTCRYEEALSVIKIAKDKLARPYLVYMSEVDAEKYTEAVGGRSLSTKFRQSLANDINLCNYTVYINDLIIEQQSILQNRWEKLSIPPLVLSLMLEVLCYKHLNTSSDKALNELLALVHYDQGKHIPIIFRDISWQILGICQQTTGDLKAALFSYQQSLRQRSFLHMETASIIRILILIYEHLFRYV